MPKGAEQISQNVKDKVLEFYQLNDFTRLCPGKKDFASLFLNGKKVHKQKRLILLHLKELYIELKRCTQITSELRSKWCINMCLHLSPKC